MALQPVISTKHMQQRAFCQPASKRRAAPALIALTLAALALALSWVVRPGFVAAPARSERGLTRRQAAASGGSGPETDVWKEAKDAPTPPEAKLTEKPGEAAPAKGEPSGGKRMRQFLALEALDDDPTDGNQWEKDLQDSENLTGEDQRKRFVAIFTGGLSLLFGVGYLVAVYVAENRDLSPDTDLGKDDIAILAESFPDK